MYKEVIRKGLIILLIILLGLLIYLIKLSYRESMSEKTSSDGTSETTTMSTTVTETTTTETTTIATTTSTTVQTDGNVYLPYHIDDYDGYSIDNIMDDDIQRVFTEKGAVVCGDSMAEGLTAYRVLSDNNVVWHRGRRIDNMDKDLDKIKSLNPSYLFLTYGSNDLELWTGRTNSFISAYTKTLDMLRRELPNTTLVINSILPVSIKKTNSDVSFSYQSEFNNALRELANSYGIVFLENSPYLSGKDKPYSSDGVHPKSFYYSLWAKHMTSYLETL